MYKETKNKMEEELFSFLSGYIELSDDEKNAIRGLSIFRSYEKGRILFREGDYTENYYFIIKGCVRCYYIIEDEEKTTAFYTEFESYAPASTVHQKPSENYAACVEDSILLVTTRETEEQVFDKFPRFETLCRILSEELAVKYQTSLENFKNLSPEQRYIHLIKTKPGLVERVPQYQIASFLGIKPESLSRIRRRLAKKNNPG
jgi:CRP-like cAMP-binding protein